MNTRPLTLSEVTDWTVASATIRRFWKQKLVMAMAAATAADRKLSPATTMATEATAYDDPASRGGDIEAAARAVTAPRTVPAPVIATAAA